MLSERLQILVTKEQRNRLVAEAARRERRSVGCTRSDRQPIDPLARDAVDRLLGG